MYTCYFNYQAEKYLHKRGSDFHKKIKSCFSMFAYNKDTNTIYIYTTHPGIWIGKMGQEIQQIKEDLAKFFAFPVEVALIETRI